MHHYFSKEPFSFHTNCIQSWRVRRQLRIRHRSKWSWQDVSYTSVRRETVIVCQPRLWYDCIHYTRWLQNFSSTNHCNKHVRWSSPHVWTWNVEYSYSNERNDYDCFVVPSYRKDLCYRHRWRYHFQLDTCVRQTSLYDHIWVFVHSERRWFYKCSSCVDLFCNNFYQFSIIFSDSDNFYVFYEE